MALTSINGVALSSVTEINGVAKTSISSIIGNTIGAVSFPTNGILDNFNRADESPLAGGWSANPFWSGDVLHRVVSNQCTPVTTGFADAMWATGFTANQEVYVTMPTVAGITSIGLYCRGINENSGGFTNQYYFAGFEADGDVVLQVQDGTETTLGSMTLSGGAIANGDSIGLSCVGSAIKVFYKRAAGAWTEVISVTETRHNVAGKVAINADCSGFYTLDDFGGGNI